MLNVINVAAMSIRKTAWHSLVQQIYISDSCNAIVITRTESKNVIHNYNQKMPVRCHDHLKRVVVLHFENSKFDHPNRKIDQVAANKRLSRCTQVYTHIGTYRC